MEHNKYKMEILNNLIIMNNRNSNNNKCKKYNNNIIRGLCQTYQEKDFFK